MMYELRYKELVGAIHRQYDGGQGWCVLGSGCERTAEGMESLKALYERQIFLCCWNSQRPVAGIKWMTRWVKGGTWTIMLAMVNNFIFDFRVRECHLRAVNKVVNIFFLDAHSIHWRIVRKHLPGSFLCAVLDLSGILCSLLIPEYSGIKRRGKPLPGLRTEESRHFLH